MASSVKKIPHFLSCLGDQHFANRRNGTDQVEPVVISVDAPRKRKRKASQKLDDLVRPIECIDVTVARLFGATTQPSTIASPVSAPQVSEVEVLKESAPQVNEVEVLKESEVLQEPEDPTVDKSNVLLPYDVFLDFQTENFCCRHCFQPLTKSRFEKSR